MSKLTNEQLKHHDCRTDNPDEYSWWEKDAQGIDLCRVCEKCVKAKLSTYRPKSWSG